MSHPPAALVVRAPGTNCEVELVRGLTRAGARAELVALSALVRDPGRIEAYDLVALPGGFSFGDDVASGRIFAMHVRERLYGPLREAASRGCPMIGVCNGFQVLVQVGLLPGPPAGARWPDTAPAATVSLAENQGGRFIDRWVRVGVPEGTPCVWTAAMAESVRGLDAHERDAVLRLPIAHGEGRLVAASDEVLAGLEAGGHVALRYEEPVNGSQGAIAGLCDASGLIFGLMPHPERYLDWSRHPFGTRLSASVRGRETPGAAMFRAAVDAARRVAA